MSDHRGHALLELRGRRPELVIRLPLEEDVGLIYVDADSLEDELRLRHWLRCTSDFRAIRTQLGRFLDQLDALDRAA